MKNILAGQKQSVFLALGGLGIGALLIAVIVFLPAVRGFHSLSKAIQEKKTALSTVKPSSGEYDALEQAVTNTKAEIELVKKNLFWESDISKFLNEVTLLASDVAIDFVSLKPEFSSRLLEKDKDKKDAEDYSLTAVPILIIIKSNYNDMRTFLERIEQTEKFISVESLNIESDRKEIYKHTIRMDLMIFTKG